ncbi:MAG: T9SS type A sorting domain-containing protein [Saprospiraceae bacterium]|nr:T9SS type A sorting domain-containing protein [Saprospiraceae bacterium]
MKKSIVVLSFLLLTAQIPLLAQAQLEFDLNTAPGDPAIQQMFAYESRLYFNADDGCHGGEPWVYDPATMETRMIADQEPGGRGSDLWMQAGYQGKVYGSNYEGIFCYDPVSRLLRQIVDQSMTSNEIVLLGGKCYYMAVSAQGRSLYSLDLSSESVEEINFTAGISTDDWNPSSFAVHNNALYFKAKNDQNLVRLFRYQPASGSLHELPMPAGITTSLNFRSMISCGNRLVISLYLNFTTPPEYTLCAYNDATDQLQPLGYENVLGTLSACFENEVYYIASGSRKLKKINPVNGAIFANFDILPGVDEKASAVKILEGAVHVEAYPAAGGANQLFRWNTAFQVFEPVTAVSDVMTQDALVNKQLERIGTQYIFQGMDTDGARALWGYSPGNIAPTILKDINLANANTEIWKIDHLGEHGYLWVNQRHILRFDTTDAPNPVWMNAEWGIDSVTSNFSDVDVVNNRLYLGRVISQGQRYGVSVYDPAADSLQHFLPNYFFGGYNFTAFQGKTYFIADSVSSSGSILWHDPGNQTVQNLDISVLGSSPIELVANEDALFVFTENKNLFRFDGAAWIQIPGTIDLLQLYYQEPFFWNGKLFFAQQTSDTLTGQYLGSGLYGLDLQTLDVALVANSESDDYLEFYAAEHLGELYISKGTLTESNLYRFNAIGDTMLLVVEGESFSLGFWTLASMNQQLLCHGYGRQYGSEWYRINLSDNQPERLTDISPLSGDGVYGEGIVIGSKMYFLGNNDIHGYELWSYRDCFSAGITATPTEHGDSTGQAGVIIDGGTAPFTFEWSNGANAQNLDNLPEGVYEVTTTDATGCKSTLHACVESLAVTTAMEEKDATVTFKTYPNPFGQWLRLESLENQSEVFLVQLIDLQGKIIESDTWDSTTPKVFENVQLPPGLYFLLLREMGGGIVTTRKVIKE